MWKQVHISHWSGRTRWLIAGSAMLLTISPGLAQRNLISRPAKTETLRFGPMVPGRSGTSMSVVLPVSLSIPAATAGRGFAVSVLSDFNFTPTSPASGGKTMTASDIGIGIVDVSWAQGLSGATVAAGFDHDPAMNGRSGFGPVGNSRSAQATLADLLSPREVIRLERIPVKAASHGAAELRVNVKLAAWGQYLTPGTFSGTITLVVPE